MYKQRLEKMDTYAIFPSYQKKCQPAKCPVPYGYPDPQTCYNPYGKTDSKDADCRPFGYQPKRPNPGGLKFYMYDYPYQTQGGEPITHPGKGWYKYERTGQYYTW